MASRISRTAAERRLRAAGYNEVTIRRALPGTSRTVSAAAVGNALGAGAADVRRIAAGEPPVRGGQVKP